MLRPPNRRYYSCTTMVSTGLSDRLAVYLSTSTHRRNGTFCRPTWVRGALRRIVVACVSWAALIGLCGCSVTTGPIQLQINEHVALPDRAVVMFVVDGMDHTCLHAMLAAGELPNIAHRLGEGGIEVEHAVDSMPSITYPNLVSVMTGLFPGHHD